MMKLLMVLMTHEYESYFMLWIKIEPLSHAEIYFSTTVVVLLHLTVTPPDITPNIKTHIMTKSHVKYPCTTLVNHPIKPHKTHKITSYPKLTMKYGPWYKKTGFSKSHGPGRAGCRSQTEIPDGPSQTPYRTSSSSEDGPLVRTTSRKPVASIIQKFFPSSVEPVGRFGAVDTQVRDPRIKSEN